MSDRMIGRYRILDAGRRAEGSEMCRAEDTLLRRRVLVWVLPPDRAGSPEACEAFLDLVSAGNGGRGRVLDAGRTHDGGFFVVLPHRTGIAGPRIRRRWAWAAAGLGVAAVVGLLWSPRAQAPRIDSVAVLPFLVSGGDAASAAPLASGLGEALLTKLTAVAGLRVTPWSTSQRIARSKLPLEQIRESLGVEALLTGTLAVRDGRLTGAMTLLAGDGRAIWTEPFEARLDDLFAMESAVALQLAQRLRGELSGKEIQVLSRGPGQSVDAYVTYLQGVDAWRGGRPRDAEPLLRKAIGLDPDLALAHTALGALLSEDAFTFRQGGPATIEEAKAHYHRAIALDPTLISARRGLIHIRGETSVDELQQGQAILRTGRRDAEALVAIGESLLSGLETQARSRFRQALENDPGNAPALWFHVIADVWDGAYAAAIRDGQTYLQRFGEDPEIHLWMAMAERALGSVDAARAHAERVLAAGGPADPRMTFQAATLLHVCGDHRAQETFLELLDLAEARLRNDPEDAKVLSARAAIHAYLGDRDGMLADLQRLRDLGEPFDNVGDLLWAGEADLGIDFALESLRRGRVHKSWATVGRALAPEYVRRSPRWAEVETVYAAEHAKLVAQFPDLAP